MTLIVRKNASRPTPTENIGNTASCNAKMRRREAGQDGASDEHSRKFGIYWWYAR